MSKILNSSSRVCKRQAKLPEALPMLQLISVFTDVFEAILLQSRYTKLLKFLTYLSSILITGGIFVPLLKTLVFFKTDGEANLCAFLR